MPLEDFLHNPFTQSIGRKKYSPRSGRQSKRIMSVRIDYAAGSKCQALVFLCLHKGAGWEPVFFQSTQVLSAFLCELELSLSLLNLSLCLVLSLLEVSVVGIEFPFPAIIKQPPRSCRNPRKPWSSKSLPLYSYHMVLRSFRYPFRALYK